MKDITANEISLRQMSINELKELKHTINDSLDDSVKFTITTNHRIGFMEMHTIKQKNKLDLSVHTMNLILDEAIKKQRERIDALIDMEIKERMITNDKD